ncbi:MULTISPECIES: hypothetical protein [Pseudomonas syringae group]|uniref:hypothetical protein n=1 Tax=Pseudomonas syringae group TaxID=136849 RepID=UPI001F3853AF|nr:hypothetical protein [Pseudomonas tremae]MCF5804334.1 hypothetical protein [Pseudomonas tremae]MCF5808649.1 hypothetical protein [Pseudomonas tremae]
MVQEERNSKQQTVEILYNALLHAANRVLHQAKNYSISVLKLENPTYAQIAAQFREVCTIIGLLTDQIDDPHTAQKAQEYVGCMEGIAQAIDADDSEALNSFVKQLDTRSFL